MDDVLRGNENELWIKIGGWLPDFVDSISNSSGEIGGRPFRAIFRRNEGPPPGTLDFGDSKYSTAYGLQTLGV